MRAHIYLHWLVPDPVAGHVELARNALDAATRLQPDSGDVHLTRAFFYYQSSRDYAAALKELAMAKQTCLIQRKYPTSRESSSGGKTSGTFPRATSRKRCSSTREMCSTFRS